MEQEKRTKTHQTMTIEVLDSPVWCIIGVYPVERMMSQRVRVSIVCTLRFDMDAQEDALPHTIDYTMIAKRARYVLREGKFSLLETAVCHICRDLLAQWESIENVHVSIAKKYRRRWYRVSAQQNR